ncbi:unnamed protein product [Sympodiomycopsis kandeliae]
MGKRRRKTRTHLKGPNNDASSTSNAPKSFVIRSGNVGRSVSSLVQDVRKVMEPNTATRLRERKSNKLRDFIAMSGPLGVSHMMIFNQTEAGINLRVARCPRGPTCTFRVNKFALMSDVLKSQKRPRAPGGEFATPPLLVLNNFGGEEKHKKLLVTVFQNLFPPIHVQSMRLSQARRVVLLSYNAHSDTIEWRHFLISIRPVGVSRSVRRVIEGTNKPGQSSSDTTASTKGKGKSLPNLGNVGDISEYVLGRSSRSGSVGAASDTDLSEAESEIEDMNDPNNTVELFQKYVGRNNSMNEQRAIRLREVGPRIELKLIKIQENITGAGSTGGETLYHNRVVKTAKETALQKKNAAEKEQLRNQRKSKQEENVARKKAEKEARKKGGKQQQSEAQEASDGDDDDDAADVEEEEEDEFEYEDRVANQSNLEEGDDDDLFNDSDDAFDDDEDEQGDVDVDDDDDEEEEEEEESAKPTRKRRS